MKKEIKKAIRELKDKGTDKVFVVVWTQYFKGLKVQYLWNIYDNKWAALNWVNLCHARSMHTGEYDKDVKNTYYEFLYAANCSIDTEYSYSVKSNGSIEKWEFICR